MQMLVGAGENVGAGEQRKDNVMEMRVCMVKCVSVSKGGKEEFISSSVFFNFQQL